MPAETEQDIDAAGLDGARGIALALLRDVLNRSGRQNLVVVH